MSTTPPVDLVEALAAEKGAEARIRLFALLAERVRTRVLSETEAAVLAGWLDQLARGDDPTAVFPKRGGRPRGRATTRYIKGKEITRPEDFDLAWYLRRQIEIVGDKDRVIKSVAKHYGMSAEALDNLYRRCLRDMPPSPPDSVEFT